MKIAVNLRLFHAGKIGGLENYVRHVVGAIAREQNRRGSLLTIFATASEIESVRQFAPAANIVPVDPARASVQISGELAREAYSLLFCPLLVLEPLCPAIPSAITIPDLQHEYHPEFFNPQDLAWRRQTYRPSVANADLVFTVSEYSKSTFIEKYGAPADKIVVVDHGVDEEFTQPPDPPAQAAWQSLKLPPDYLFYPANFWPHKNHIVLLDALQRLRQSGCPNLALVLTGAADGSDRIRQEIKRRKLQGAVFLLPYQKRKVVAELYRHARALAFVSRFEGFGIPLLEAFHTGTPVISAGACSCPEVAGDAAIYVDETNPDSIASGIRRVLENPHIAAELVARGTEQAQRHSWQNAVDATLEAIARLATEPRARVAVREYPTVSIVTPSYNMGRFLGETIESVLGQDYPHVEYIVMDGGSTDGTQELLRKFEGRLRYESKKDAGQADAINQGFRATRGEIFTFLNADDLYQPGAVGKAVDQFLRSPAAGVVYGEAQYIDETGATIGPYPTSAYDPALLNQQCFICQPAAFLRRDAYKEAGGIDDRLHFALDYDLWIRMSRLYPFAKVDDVLAASRMHRDNKTIGQRRRMYQETISVARRHFGYVPYEPLLGYANYLLDGKDQIFDVSRPSLPKLSLCLALGLYYNPRQPLRYGAEWARELGLFREFTGRFPDGWIADRYVLEETFSDVTERIVISGQHAAPKPRRLTVTVKLNGRPVERAVVPDRGPFAVSVQCPADARGRHNRIEIECSPTFRRWHGDYRRLSCIIDSVRLCGAR